MAVVSSVFGTRFSQKQLKIIPMSSNKPSPWKFNCAFAGSSSPWNSKQKEKYTSKLKLPLEPEKQRDKGQQNLYFGRLAPHIRHLFVTNFHYDGNISRYLEARNKKSAMRNLTMWYSFPIQSLLLSMTETTRKKNCSGKSNAFFSSRTEKKDSSTLILWWKKMEMWIITVCTLIDNKYASLLLLEHFFLIVSACWASLQMFMNRKVCSV